MTRPTIHETTSEEEQAGWSSLEKSIQGMRENEASMQRYAPEAGYSLGNLPNKIRAVYQEVLDFQRGSMNRPSIHQTMFDIARATAKRSTCPAAQVGAVIARDGVIVSVGYNGAPRGVAHCDVAGCVVIRADMRHGIEDDFELVSREYSRHLHAEWNAILHCARDGRSTDGCEIYVTLFPCLDCLKAIMQAGIVCVHMAGTEDDGGLLARWYETVGRFGLGHIDLRYHTDI